MLRTSDRRGVRVAFFAAAALCAAAAPTHGATGLIQVDPMVVQICSPLACTDPDGREATGLTWPGLGPPIEGVLFAEERCDYDGRDPDDLCRLRIIGSIGPLPDVGGAWCGAFAVTGAVELIAGPDRFFGELDWRQGPGAGVLRGFARDGEALSGLVRLRAMPATGDCGVTAPTDRFVVDVSFIS